MHEMAIGEVARLTGLAPSTLRYYEKMGLLPPPRRRSKQRRYDADVLGRIDVVRTALDSGFTIAETRIFISGFAPETPPSLRWKTLAATKLRELDDVMRRTRRMKRLLQTSFDCGCLKLDDCEKLFRRQRMLRSVPPVPPPQAGPRRPSGG